LSKSIVKSNKSVESLPKNNNNSMALAKNQLPQLREVNSPVNFSESQNLITAYKDLNEPLRNFNKQQQKNLIIGLVVFTLLGMGILMGQSLGGKRVVASADMQKFIPAGAKTTINEHYHYEKSCYKGADGEDVCVTRSSLKK
jgi:hypothetical protein